MNERVYEELRALVERWKDGLAGERWTEEISKDIDAALEAAQMVLRGDLSAEDAQVTVERRLEAAAWSVAGDVEEVGREFAADLAKLVIKLAVEAVVAVV